MRILTNMEFAGRCIPPGFPLALGPDVTTATVIMVIDIVDIVAMDIGIQDTDTGTALAMGIPGMDTGPTVMGDADMAVAATEVAGLDAIIAGLDAVIEGLDVVIEGLDVVIEGLDVAGTDSVATWL